jgi:hypothetical protein
MISPHFVEKIEEIFEKSINLFESICCKGSPRNCFFLSDIAKKVFIDCEEIKDEDKGQLFEGNYSSITDELTIRKANYL